MRNRIYSLLEQLEEEEDEEEVDEDILDNARLIESKISSKVSPIFAFIIIPAASLILSDLVSFFEVKDVWSYPLVVALFGFTFILYRNYSGPFFDVTFSSQEALSNLFNIVDLF